MIPSGFYGALFYKIFVTLEMFLDSLRVTKSSPYQLYSWKERVAEGSSKWVQNMN